MELLIVRHGETLSNLQGRIQGQAQGTLSKRGMKQSIAVSKALKKSPVDVVFSSDLRRARQMAREIAKRTDAPVYFTKDLRARHSGDFEGRLWEDIVKEVGAKKAYYSVRFKFGKNGESMMDVQKRLRRFVGSVQKDHPNETVVVCTHRHCVAVLLAIIFGVPVSFVIDHMKDVKNSQVVGNSEIVRLQIDGKKVVYRGDNRNILEIMSMRQSRGNA